MPCALEKGLRVENGSRGASRTGTHFSARPRRKSGFLYAFWPRNKAKPNLIPIKMCRRAYGRYIRGQKSPQASVGLKIRLKENQPARLHANRCAYLLLTAYCCVGSFMGRQGPSRRLHAASAPPIWSTRCRAALAIVPLASWASRPRARELATQPRGRPSSSILFSRDTVSSLRRLRCASPMIEDMSRVSSMMRSVVGPLPARWSALSLSLTPAWSGRAFAKCLLNFGLRPDRPAGIRHRQPMGDRPLRTVACDVTQRRSAL